MDQVLDTVPSFHWELAKDGPWPIEWYLADANEVPLPRANTLRAELTWKGGGTLVKTVGAGITLLAMEGVAGSFVSLQLSETDLSGIPDGAVVKIRFREGVSPNRQVVMAGKVTFK